MKTSIHPTWHPDAEVTCACGNLFTIGSTKAKIRVDICSRCHPFFTGEMKYVDTQGRVEKFQASVQKAVDTDYSAKRAVKKGKKQPLSDDQPRTLREMLLELQK